MVCRGCAFLSGSLFHFTQQDAVVIQILACVLAELFKQVVHGHPAAFLALHIKDDAAG